MKSLILYYSKNNTTKETVEKISRNKDVDVCDLSKLDNVRISDYENIYIGSGIYMGSLPGTVKKHIKKISKSLEGKNIIYFVHGIISQKNYKEIINNSIGEYLSNSNTRYLYLGGKLDVSKQNFIIKKMLKQIAKQNNLNPNYVDTRNRTCIEGLINDIK